MSDDVQVEIQSLVFGPEGAEVSYIEHRDVDTGSGILLIRTLQVPYDACEEAFDDLGDAVRALVDAALLKRRNPPEQVRRGL